MALSTDDKPVTLSGERLRFPPRSQEDLEFAEFARAATLSEEQADTLIKLIKRCERNPGAFTFERARDVEQSPAGTSKSTCTDH